MRMHIHIHIHIHIHMYGFIAAMRLNGRTRAMIRLVGVSWAGRSPHG